MRIRGAAFAVALTLALVPAAPARAGTTLDVPADHATIGAAVAVAQPGDVILIDGGTYTESVVIDGLDDITLKGKRGATIDGTGLTACIDLLNVDGVKISGLTLSGGGTGLRVDDSSNVSMSKSTVTGSTTMGVQISDSTDVTIERSTIENCTGTGLRVSGRESAVNPRVTRLVLREIGGNGIESLGVGEEVSRNVLENIGGTGIQVHGDDAVVTRNTVNGTGSDGIQTFGARSPVTRCRVEDAGGEGIQTFDPDSPIDRCVSVNSTSDGIQTFGANSPITRSQVIGSGGEGLQTFGDDSPVEKSRVEGTTDEAIQTFGLRNHVVKCRINGSGTDGVEVFDPESNVERCKIIGVTAIGITAANEGVVSRNKILAPGTNGIVVSSPLPVSVERNKIKDAGGTGIVAVTGGHTFTKNSAKGSAVLDADDQVPGQNTWTKNKFGTSNIP